MAKKFKSGFHAMTATPIAISTNNDGNMAEAEQWVVDNCTGKFYVNNVRRHKLLGVFATFYFEFQDDAMAFTLRWK